MTERILAPVVIGVTGKRDLKGKDAAVRVAFGQVFDDLDARFPKTPKILLSALAEGADTIAAEEALRRSSWQVVAPLPLSLDLYIQDFSAVAAERLATLMADPRVRALTLDPLREARSDRPLEAAVLARRSDGANPERTLHYEQMGLFIAERCSLLLAVMPSEEKPGRIGGTARIVDYRLRGVLDADAHEVVRRSQLLRETMLLDRPRAGAVWLIDLANVDAKGGTRAPRGYEVWLPDEEPARRPWSDRRSTASSLRLIRGIEEFNRRALDLSDAQWRRDVEKRAGEDAGDAGSAIRRIRLALSAIQVKYNARVKRSVWALAILFVVAILAFEFYVELSSYKPLRGAIAVYDFMVLVALAVFWRARKNRWQPIAEDYRALAEALRVQLAWWDVGLGGPDHRVERFYLRGTLGSLGLVRAAVRQMLDAALLGRPSPKAATNAGSRWIDGQLTFFRDRIDARRLSVLRIEASSWFLFVASLVPAIVLALMQTRLHDTIYATFVSSWRYCSPPILLSALAVATGLIFWGTALARLFLLKRYSSPRKRIFDRLAGLIALCTGLLFTAGLYDLAAVLPSPGEHLGVSDPIEGLAEKLVAVAAIFPPAIAGAIRFVAEKLSLEAEMHGYRDAFKIFRRAKAALAAIDDAPDDPVKKTARRADLFFALGKEALEENERWLRAHRERPLEPVVGG